MAITYRNHYDARDGQVYKCCLMPDGKWWSSRNLEWVGGGVPGIAGRLYSQDAGINGVPPGSHVPIDAEWNALTASLGVAPSLYSKPLRSTSGWSNNGGDTYGFKLLPGGVSYGSGVLSPTWGYYWSASPLAGNPANGYYYVATPYSYEFGSASGADTVLQSVRFIVDTFVDPPTLITGIFSGSGVRAFMSVKSLGASLEIPIVSQTTSALTIDPEFIETWGKQSGPVKIMVVDGEYVSDWIDWEFK